jgi:flagellar basal-body rod modification protein FlgD
MTTSISGVTANNLASASTGTSKSKVNTADEQSERFLKLLVAQMNNQDPLNPMDNAQMTSQMAQINTVSGIQQVNTSIQAMAQQFASLQMLQGASMVGRDVLIPGNALNVDAGVGKGAIELSGSASSVNIEVLTPGGQLVDTIQLGNLPAGRTSFEWDASQYTGGNNLTFKATAIEGGKAVATTSFVQSKVASVGTSNGTMTVQLKGREAVLYSDISAIL